MFYVDLVARGYNPAGTRKNISIAFKLLHNRLFAKIAKESGRNPYAICFPDFNLETQALDPMQPLKTLRVFCPTKPDAAELCAFIMDNRLDFARYIKLERAYRQEVPSDFDGAWAVFRRFQNPSRLKNQERAFEIVQSLVTLDLFSNSNESFFKMPIKGYPAQEQRPEEAFCSGTSNSYGLSTRQCMRPVPMIKTAEAAPREGAKTYTLNKQ